MMDELLAKLEAERAARVRGPGAFPIRAYSELMPPPYVGTKPYGCRDATFSVAAIDEYEQAHDLQPGLDRIAAHVITELGKLMRGEAHALSHTLLADNPAWPTELARAAKAGALADDPLVLAMALALSRTQDDKGNDRWTLFGTSHDGPSGAFWRATAAQLEAIVRFAGIAGLWRIVADDLPVGLHHLRYAGLTGVRAIVTFTPFARLPDEVRAAYLARELVILPTPASLIFFEHPRYRELARVLPRATQIPLLHLFPRVTGSCTIRIPQSGWLDEGDGHGGHGHRVVNRVARHHRWERVERDHGDGAFTDKVSTALFSTDADAIGLYDKPLAKNCEIWTADYELLLDGPRADAAAIARAAERVDAGGRFGYRLFYPAMQAGIREVYWHVPLVAKPGERMQHGPHGYLSLEADREERIELAPELLARPAHVQAAALDREPGKTRYTSGHNARKLLDARELLGAPVAPAFARALLRVSKHALVDEWLDAHPAFRGCVGAAEEPGEPLVIPQLGTRAVAEQIWHTIASLAEGSFRQKENADGIAVNKGKHGGPAAKAAKLVTHERRDLEALGDHLHDRYRALAATHGLGECVDHVFRWETDFSYPWMEGWAKNQRAPAERNIVFMIPGKNRREAVIMGDHYDTAYMEDVYEPERGGDGLRAPAVGADDNHSATTALLLAAEHLLPLAAAGRLERDVWLVHLTGEEFPADSLGARAVCQGLVERSLAFTAEDGARRDVSGVRVVGAFVLDMIGHNTERDRDVFQIAPGEGAAAMRLAHRAHLANLRWNRFARAQPHGERAHRMPDGSAPPPPFGHLPLHGEVRVEWEPHSALYNTDGQVFSDVGVPIVLFMENYDISRTGYHDTLDTMANIDLDYCAAMTAIAIETVAETACAP